VKDFIHASKNLTNHILAKIFKKFSIKRKCHGNLGLARKDFFFGEANLGIKLKT
jgi:hypothetical protein